MKYIDVKEVPEMESCEPDWLSSASKETLLPTYNEDVENLQLSVRVI